MMLFIVCLASVAVLAYWGKAGWPIFKPSHRRLWREVDRALAIRDHAAFDKHLSEIKNNIAETNRRMSLYQPRITVVMILLAILVLLTSVCRADSTKVWQEIEKPKAMVNVLI